MSAVKQLVQEQYEKMGLANKKTDWETKQMALESRCQNIVYNEWGVGTQELWDSIKEHVEELIPSIYEEEE